MNHKRTPRRYHVIAKLILAFWMLSFLPCHALPPIQRGFVPMSDQTPLWVTFVPAATQPAKKVVVFLLGLSAFYEKNADFMDILSGRAPLLSQDPAHPIPNAFTKDNIDVWIIDHRGHGRSGGRLSGADHQKAHVTDFRVYVDDIHLVVTQKILPHYATKPTPDFIVIGSSFGGHLALRYLQTHTHPFQKAVLLVPMLEFPTKPWPRFLAKLYVKLATYLGFGAHYAPGYKDFKVGTNTRQREGAHHNQPAFEKTQHLLQTHPDWITSGPTMAWVAAAFDSVQASLTPHALQHVTIPVHLFKVPQDTYVDNSGIEIATQHLPRAHLTTIIGAWHNIMKEVDAYRVPFLKSLREALR